MSKPKQKLEDLLGTKTAIYCKDWEEVLLLTTAVGRHGWAWISAGKIPGAPPVWHGSQSYRGNTWVDLSGEYGRGILNRRCGRPPSSQEFTMDQVDLESTSRGPTDEAIAIETYNEVAELFGEETSSPKVCPHSQFRVIQHGPLSHRYARCLTPGCDQLYEDESADAWAARVPGHRLLRGPWTTRACKEMGWGSVEHFASHHHPDEYLLVVDPDNPYNYSLLTPVEEP